jgi:twitching motility protein PilT
MSRMTHLLECAVANGASDLHIVVGLPPLQRVHTVLGGIQGEDVVALEEAETAVKELLTDDQYEKFLEQRDMDFSASLPTGTRFRVNAHFQRGTPALSFRAIPSEVPEIETLNLPPVVTDFANLPMGLVLVTGETGSGKSTTLASMIDYMNRRYAYHVITLEDPIEYYIPSRKCAVEQREVGADVPNFRSGLRHVLRQDPDVILVGEMRDLETISTALTAAETGHLVLSTLHTNDAASTIQRVIDMFPAGQQNQIRSMFSDTLKGVLCQRLVSRSDQPGMVPIVEVMVSTPAIRNCIREDRVFEIPNVIETNRALGMQLFDESLKQHYFSGHISREAALANAKLPSELARALSA